MSKAAPGNEIRAPVFPLSPRVPFLDPVVALTWMAGDARRRLMIRSAMGAGADV